MHIVKAVPFINFSMSIYSGFCGSTVVRLPLDKHTCSHQPFEVTQSESCFVERGLLIAFYFLVLRVLFAHLRSVDCHGPGKDIGIQLAVFYVAKMLGKSFGGQGLSLALVAFVPPDPPTLDILSSVDPNLSHNTESIVIGLSGFAA